MPRLLLLPIALLALALPSLPANEDEWLRPLGPPPKAKPRRISGGESFPPLPLPATPLRRSERKREPSPPKLIGKVVWGSSAVFTSTSGKRQSVADWNMCPGDVSGILNRAGRFLGTRYSSQSFPLADFHGDPEKTPVLFFSGGRTLRFTPEETKILRAYIRSGGMAVFDSIAGSPYFYQAARTRATELIPGEAIRVLPADHPLYHIIHPIEEARYSKNVELKTPFLEGIYVGCRIGILISRYGLGCGWDNRPVPMIEKAQYYDVDTANRIGVNLIAYAVGYGNVGREEAKPELFGRLDEERPTDELVFAQVRHEGAWNGHPGGAAALLRRMRTDTAVRVSLKRITVSLAKDDISTLTFLYLCGMDDFGLSEKERTALRGFISAGGTLLINNSLGLKTFDTAVRRELAKVFPKKALAAIPTTHDLYNTALPVGEVRYTSAVVHTNPEWKAPRLLGIEDEGDLRVIYSPLDIEAGWQGCEHPLSRGYEPHSATQLGINILVYAATH
ncbi:MAG: DUF4159 domain-containing protein [Planctomycetota bacterium]|jgi:hypothetical protein